MTKQRKVNSTYAIVMVIGLAFMLLFGYLVKPFSTVTVTGVKMLGVLIGLIVITCFNGDLLSGSLMALLATLFHGYYDISGLLNEWLGRLYCSAGILRRPVSGFAGFRCDECFG